MRFLAACVLLCLANARAEAQTPKTPPLSDPPNAQPLKLERERPAARIRGRVVTDGGRPVPDATIMILPVNFASNMQSSITSMFRPVTSDADGKFELSSVRSGAYSLSASAPGYVSSEPDPKVYYRPGDNATITLIKGGVITGRVTNSLGEAVVAALVRAIKIREPNSKPVRMSADVGSQINQSMDMILGPFQTDDRGIYRIYGLTPGYYQVAAGGRSGAGFSFGVGNAYDGDAPTYFPSSTLETAEDVSVLAGEEAANIDIRYRGNRGHSIGGMVTVSGGPAPQVITVTLTRAGNGVVEATTVAMAGRDNFGFDAVPDGEYLLNAMGTSANLAIAGPEGLTASASQPRRVTIRGADVSGINLVIEPLGSIAGRVVLEALQDAKQREVCKEFRPAPIEGTVLSTLDDRKEMIDSKPIAAFLDTTPDEKGEFIFSLVQPGTHWLTVRLPAEHLYLKALTLQPSPNARPIEAAKIGVKVKSGEKVKGLIVTMREGAARLSGKVLVGADNKPPEEGMSVHLVPSEPESAEDMLRYFETTVSSDGTFALTNLPPGKYWLVGRETSDTNVDDRKTQTRDAGARAALRFEGEASKSPIELAHCQTITDYRFKYVPLTKPAKPPAKKSGP